MRMIRQTAVVVLLCAAAMGCGKTAPPIAPVTGLVTYEGQPLPGRAVVHFVNGGGFGASCEVEKDGTFKMGSEYGRGIPLGEYEVSIMPPVPSPADTKADTHPDYHFIPERYREFSTSKLTATITAEGPNEFKFDMKK